MLNKILNSIAFRLPVLLYKNLLNFRPPPKLTDKPLANFNYVALCGKTHYPFLKQVLLSINKHFTELPFLYIFLDFSFTNKHLQDIHLFYPASKLKIVTAAECLEYHHNKGNIELIKIAKSNAMVLKLAALLQILELKSPILYADTDVLWLNNPIEIIKNLIQGPLSMHMQYDIQPGYDFNLVEKAGLVCLNEEPLYCAGLMLINKLSAEQEKIINNLLAILSEGSDHFSEQTIFAYLQKTSGTSCLTPDKFVLSCEDQFQIRSTNNNYRIARHYIGPVRHLFWRDAFFN